MIITLIRTTVLYIFVTLGIRLMGKRQIGDMQPNELVVTLLISEIAAIPLQDTKQPVLNGIAAIFMLVILEIIISVLAMKFAPVRKMMSGNSAVIIKNGVIDQSAMKRVRMTVIDLIELLRGQGYFDIDEVAFAVLEVNGSLSVVPKTAYKPARICDIGKKVDKEGLQLPVISDGKIVSDSLDCLNLKREDIIKKIHPTPIKNVYLMTIDRYGNQNLIVKRKDK